MGRSKTQGIYAENDGSFTVDAWINKQRIRKRGFTRHADAESFLTARKGEISLRLAVGRPAVLFDQAAARWLEEKVEKPSWETDRYLLAPVVGMIGSLKLEDVSNDTLAPFIEARREQGRAPKTINNALSLIQSILSRAAEDWRHANGLTWIPYAPKIELVKGQSRPPRPISWDEQRRLIPALPSHLAKMALFDLNTGLREAALCHLSWAWEARVPLSESLTVSVFVVPRRYVKGRKRERLVVCNRVAQSIVDGQRGLHPERVFTFARQTKEGSTTVPKQKPVAQMNNTAWQRVREEVGLGDLHVHDLRHTVGMRLRDAGVLDRTQDDILWHENKSMTNHYAVAQVREIYEALEKIAQPGANGESQSLLAVVRAVQLQAVPQKSPSNKKAA